MTVFGPTGTSLGSHSHAATPILNLQNLAAGTHYFGVRAYSSAGAESVLSNVVSKTIH